MVDGGGDVGNQGLQALWRRRSGLSLARLFSRNSLKEARTNREACTRSNPTVKSRFDSRSAEKGGRPAQHFQHVVEMFKLVYKCVLLEETLSLQTSFLGHRAVDNFTTDDP